MNREKHKLTLLCILILGVLFIGIISGCSSNADSGMFVLIDAYGDSGDPNVVKGIAAYSADGINWTNSELLPSLDGYIDDGARWSSVCYGDDKFVAIFWGSCIAAYSKDGIKWTKFQLPRVGFWQSLTYGFDEDIFGFL